MKTTCNGCPALQVDKCKLKYRTIITYRKTKVGTIKNVGPMEYCPKPVSYHVLSKILNYDNKQLRLEFDEEVVV